MRKLLIDPLQNEFKVAIVDDQEVVYRGSRSSLEDIRTLQKAENIDQVYIDAGFFLEKNNVAQILWGWIPMKFKVGDCHFVDDVINQKT